MSEIRNGKDFRNRMKMLVEYRIGEFNEPIRREINGMPGSGDEIDDIMLDEDKEKGEGDNGMEGKAPEGDPQAQEPKPEPQAQEKPEGGGEKADFSKDEIGNIAPPPAEGDEPVEGGTSEPEGGEPKPDMEAVFSQQMEKMNSMFDSMKSMMDTLMQQQGSQDNQVQAELDQVKAELEEIKPPTPEEQFDLISKESYPYNLKLSDVWKGYFEDDNDAKEDNNQGSKASTYKMDVDDAVQDMNDEEVKDSLDLNRY